MSDQEKRTKKRSLAQSSASSNTVAVLQKGQVLSGRYRIIERVGVGGMGVVYRVEDMKWNNREFALKALPPDMAQSTAAIKRLRREADAAIELHHPSIMALHSLDNDGDHYFLVMEFLDGPDLENALADKEKFSVEEVLAIAHQVCPALDHAHKMGIVHRDIKPGNLLYDQQGNERVVKVADFGIAYQIRDSVARITGQDTTGGTMHYMPPEQLAGEEPDKRADQYSLAATLYELLRGRPPFQGAGGVLMRQIEEKSVKPIDGIPEHINKALIKAMAKKPDDRFDDCQSLLAALEGKLEVVPIGVDKKAEKQGSLLPLVVLFLSILGIVLFYFEMTKTSQVIVKEPTKKSVVTPPPPSPQKFGTLYVASKPEGAQIVLDGKKTGKLTNTVLRNIAFGKHQLTLSKEKHLNKVLSVNIEQEGLTNLPIAELETSWGKVQLNGGPANSTFKLIPLDREAVATKSYIYGQTVSELEAGRYLVEVKAPLHQQLTKEIVVHSQGKTTITTIELPKLKSELKLSSNPAGASIFIDGEAVKESTPTALELTCGTHEIEVTKGDLYWKGSVDIGEEERSKKVELAIRKAPVVITSEPVGALVELGSKKLGTTTDPLKVELEVGDHEFIFSGLSSYRDKSARLAVKAGSKNSLHVVMEKMMGTIDINVTPLDADVTINRKSIAKFPVQLSPGEYVIKLSKDCYQSQATVVSVADSERTTYQFDLESKLKERAAGTEETFHGIKFVWCPPGVFQMGSPKGDKYYEKEELQHAVVISRGFWISKYEITQAQFKIAAEKHKSHFVGDRLPVDSVSHFLAHWMTVKLNEKENKRIFLLPTEAQWEYACRAGTKTPYSFGEQITPEQANFSPFDLKTKKPLPSARNKTTEVGSFPANAWGIHDMHGNVAEWCSDSYKQDYYKTSPQIDPSGPSTHYLKVVRGGMWAGPFMLCRSAFRMGIHKSEATPLLGIRLVREEPKQEEIDIVARAIWAPAKVIDSIKSVWPLPDWQNLLKMQIDLGLEKMIVEEAVPEAMAKRVTNIQFFGLLIKKFKEPNIQRALLKSYAKMLKFKNPELDPNKDKRYKRVQGLFEMLNRAAK